MVRKLLLTSALLFALGTAFGAKPVAAVGECDCDLCTGVPNTMCSDGQGLRWLCSEYALYHC